MDSVLHSFAVGVKPIIDNLNHRMEKLLEDEESRGELRNLLENLKRLGAGESLFVVGPLPPDLKQTPPS
ncbi:MAG: hypothetical protein OXC09_11575 [Truepera sp.]|nr:hypothetical protein [Truepera sp.]